ncbi:hypothetical protein I4U23_026263 [Adineta vaga]|uniref:RBR-type E3 ubiquitin transferase n=1 Tax=Adineta vaga TaxID=104782 RepID=B3G3Y2_ADIVA|nr:IBR containing protein [Adineta vaga]UJR23243.1 hypothetical protein I4U23_026263 [Adineta vaga]
MSNQCLSSWTETSITSYMTPPIRRITSKISTNCINSNEQISLNRNLSHSIDSLKKLRKTSFHSVKQSITDLHVHSFSRKSFSSNNDSLESLPFNPSDTQDDDDASSNDENQSISNISSKQRIRRNSFSLSHDNPIEISECIICLEEVSIHHLRCCSSSICSKCLYLHLSTNINEGRIRLLCPSCSHIFTHEEILLLLTKYDYDGILTERYKRFYADINGESHIKTCPRCCSIKEIDKHLVEGIRWKRTIPRKILCNECQFEWCFYCHSPWHEKMSCKQYQKGDKMLRSWATQIDQNQHNAQKCPRCKVYISRNGGCPHMICSKCQCDFCYNCGRRRLGLKFFGSHESRYSPFGCKYNLYPDKPILRRTVRGLVTGFATLTIPVAVVGAVAILAVGTTIAVPTYGTYRLIKHIRSKRYERHQRHRIEDTLSRQWTTNDSLISTYVNGTDEQNIEVDNIEKAIQASLITFREETIRREEQSEVSPYLIKHLHHFNPIDLDNQDSDDSFDE